MPKMQHEISQNSKMILSIKSLFILLVVPFLSCANNSKTIPEIAFGTRTEISIAAKTIDHKIWNDLLQKHVSNKGNVNYKGFKKDQEVLQSYLDLLSKNLPDKSWSKNAILAYWINAYNAFTVKLILDNYPVKSIKKIDSPWDKEFFNLGAKKYSLGEIEHKILRKMNEPRIHFAINCASFSCPNIADEAYTESKLEQQLTSATENFLKDASKNSLSSNKAELSQIFDWFAGDFKTNGSLISFINKYSTIKINEKAKISFKEYNWNLNE